MAEKSGRYRIDKSLLANKGTAEPILRARSRLELVGEETAAADDGRKLTEAVLRTAHDRLAASPVGGTAGAAPLTDLLDPSLVGVVSPHSGQVARLKTPVDRHDAEESVEED